MASALQANTPSFPQGIWFGDYFEFNEEPLLCQQIVQTMNLEGSSSLLDLDWVDGTLENECTLNGISYQGQTPYSDAVTRSAGSANLLNPFEYFDLGTTYDWVVCIGLAAFPFPGDNAMFVNNLKRHANTAIVVSWFCPQDSSPYLTNLLATSEVEALFAAEGLTRDLITEGVLKNQADPQMFLPQILYVFR
jgi:hypothetical protein